MEENISVANQCITEENPLRLQKEVEVKIITETFKKCKALWFYSSNLNEKKEELGKINLRNFNEWMERRKLKKKTFKKKIRKTYSAYPTDGKSERAWKQY